MRVKRLVLCMMLSLALVVTFIPVMSYAGEDDSHAVTFYGIDSFLDDGDGYYCAELDHATVWCDENYDSEEDCFYDYEGGKFWFYFNNFDEGWYVDEISWKSTVDNEVCGWAQWDEDEEMYYIELPIEDNDYGAIEISVELYSTNNFTDFADIVGDAVPIGLGSKKPVDTEGMFAFTPKVSGTYAFVSYHDTYADADPVGQVLDSEGYFIADGDDNYSNMNFYITFDAVAGKTYYLQAINYSGSAVFGVNLVEAAHKWTHVASPGGYLVNGVEYDKCDICGAIVNQNVIPGWATSYVKGLKVAKGKGKITVKWKKQSKKNLKKFNGYQIRYSTSPDMSGAKYVNVGKKSKSKKIGKLAKKTKYYVQMRSYTGGFYSGWSAVKSVKTK